MVKIALGLIAGLVVSASLAAAPPKKPPRGHFGSQWLGKDNVSRHLQLGVNVKAPAAPDPAIYREAAFDWRRSNAQTGPYPAGALAKEQEGIVPVRLSISALGRVTTCALRGSSGVPSLDAHACPHVLAKVHFRPRLDRHGQRVAASVDAEISYSIIVRFYSVAPGRPPEQPPRPGLLSPATIDSLGLSAALPKPVKPSVLSYRLSVNASGAPIACLITSSDGSDMTDKLTCEALLSRLRFEPAKGKDGQPIAADYYSYIEWR